LFVDFAFLSLSEHPPSRGSGSAQDNDRPLPRKPKNHPPAPRQERFKQRLGAERTVGPASGSGRPDADDLFTLLAKSLMGETPVPTCPDSSALRRIPAVCQQAAWAKPKTLPGLRRPSRPAMRGALQARAGFLTCHPSGTPHEMLAALRSARSPVHL